jgi:putative DNA primase/helicase
MNLDQYNGKAERFDDFMGHSVPEEPQGPPSQFDGLSTSKPVKESIQSITDIERVLMQKPTQENVALMFRGRMDGKLLFAHSHGKWYEWDGTRWKREETQKALNFARDISRYANVEGKSSLATASFYSGVETICRADRAFAIQGSEFDSDNYLLGTPDGTIDLRTNTLRSPKQDDLITMQTSISPKNEHAYVFINFLDDITCGDAELKDFLQVALGSCLSGAVENHWILFWTGNGRNGKNTLGDLVEKILGDYSKKVSSDLLIVRQGFGAHPTEIADLQGVRLAVSSEVNDSDHWNEARVNELTGDYELSARFMRADFFRFKRTHKHLVYGNHRPQIRNLTAAVKSRFKIVPFKASFVGREDPLMPEKLWGEAGFVLAWLLEGHRRWVELGRKLPPCRAVEDESEDFFASQSTIEAWIDECLVRCSDEEETKAKLLYDSYRDWKSERGEQPQSMVRWAESMSKKFSKVKKSTIFYRGVWIKHA